MREWLSVIVIIAIILILLDGFRRKFRSRSALRVKLDKTIPVVDPDEDLSAELPAGGARIRTRGDEARAARKEPGISSDFIDDDDENDEDWGFGATHEALPDEDTRFTAADAENSASRDELHDDMEEAEAREEIEKNDSLAAQRDRLKSGGERDHGDDADMEDEFDEAFADEFDEDSVDNLGFTAEQEDAPQYYRKTAGPSQSQLFQNELELGDESAAGDGAADPGDEDEDDSPLEVEEVIIINVMAPRGELLSGKAMLPILLQQGLRLGNMSLFHRHADNNGNGPVMFSMANMVKPGTFDMSEMDTFTSPGVSLFMQLPSDLNYMQSFDRMLATANALKDALGGELKDENRSVLTRQTIGHYRQRIRDFELKQLAKK